MKRSAPLERTPLRPSATPLARGAGLTRTTKLTARKVTKRFADKRVPGFARYVRGYPCAIAGCWPWPYAAGQIPCGGSRECAHLRSRGAGGEDVGNCVSLCRDHHQQSHTVGLRSFQRRYGVSLADRAARIATRWRVAVTSHQEGGTHE